MSDWESDEEANAAAMAALQSKTRKVYQRDQRNYARGNNKIIFIPSSYVGLVIGKGGNRIQDLKSKSNAQIIIGDSSGVDTNVTLRGTNSAINKAEKMIQEIINLPPKQSQINLNKDSFVAPKPTVKSPFTIIDSDGNETIDWAKAKAASDEAHKRELAKLPPIVKNFYIEDPVVAAMSPEEVTSCRRDKFNIQVRRTVNNADAIDIPNPVCTFEQAFKDYPGILKAIRENNFEKPTPIQCQAWPILLKGENMIGIAQTGTGKTIAYLLPALIHIVGQPTPRDKRPGPTVLVLGPTRELILQIQKELTKYKYQGIKSVCVYGGVDKNTQIEIISKGVDIVIATPGRLVDLISSDYIQPMHFSFVVLDEADKMLDMGFHSQVNTILEEIRPGYQCIMVSATWPISIHQLAEKFMSNPIHVNVGSLNLAAVHSVVQIVKVVEQSEKEQLLYDFLENRNPTDRILIFCGKKALAVFLLTQLLCMGIKCESLHSGKDQDEREQALEDMVDGTVNILVATDVVSRGIDIKDLTHVINLDFPLNIEEYVHRIGRTGRAGRTGIALSFLTKSDGRNAQNLINILVEANQEVPEDLHELAYIYSRRRGTGSHRRGRGRGARW